MAGRYPLKMPAVRPDRSDGFLFPPPPKQEGQIFCLVVEKKGDETRTSMRQSEIYAYSSDIIIRDGYMVMPKICWSQYNPGDWFICEREFSKDRYGEIKEERELVNLHKVDKNCYAGLNIPPTRFDNGYVQLLIPFVMCPDFIRNKETRNAYGAYKKLYLLHVGQGFVPNHRPEFKSLRPGRVYKGIFEFRAKDNGAVNFGHRNEIRDPSGHVYERDAMWELVKLVYHDDVKKRQDISVDELPEMKKDLEDLLTWAQQYEEELIERGSYGPPPPRNEPEISLMPPPSRPEKAVTSDYNIVKPAVKPQRPSGNARVDQLRKELAEMTLAQKQASVPPPSLVVAQGLIPPDLDIRVPSPTLVPPPALPQRPQDLSRRFDPAERDRTRRSLADSRRPAPESPQVFRTQYVAPARVIITSHQELEEHRARVIMRASFHDDASGKLIQKWIDRETSETSPDQEILNFKFDARYGAHDNPLLRAPQATLSDSFYNTTASDRLPLASSTPLASPEAQRRRLAPLPPLSRIPSANTTLIATRGIAADPIIRNMQTINDDTNVTETLFEMRRDLLQNNANPVGHRRRIGG